MSYSDAFDSKHNTKHHTLPPQARQIADALPHDQLASHRQRDLVNEDEHGEVLCSD